MRRKLYLLVFLALVAPLALPQVAAAAKTARILVHFEKSAGAARQEALIGRVEGKRLATVHRLGTAIVRVPAAEKRQALALLRRQSGVTYAEADGIVQAYAVTVNDPYSIAPYATWPLANPLFPDAWSLTTGDSSRGRKCVRIGRRTVCSFGTLAAGKKAKLSFVARVTKRSLVKASVAGNSAETSLANNAAHAKTR